ncbi:MAG: class I SAM-dependent methyltransferase [Bacteroidales bacterium]|nr:class I SAM-dependent methyltransferase [Bacteroidales bacterium]
MDEIDRNEYITRYQERLDHFGYSPATLGWGKEGRQDVRFKVLSELIIARPQSSVLDVGCGFGDLYRFLINNQWHGKYYGIDIVPGLLNMAKEIDPDINVFEADVTSSDFPSADVKYDFVVASGVFNAKIKLTTNEEHIKKALIKMYSLSNIAVCVDFMSTYVDFQDPLAFHTDPGWAFNVAKGLSRRVMLRHDYMPYEFTLIIYKDDSISSRNIFHEFEKAGIKPSNI